MPRRSFPNIEYRRFPGHKHLVGYARVSGVWHIHGRSGSWYARCASNRSAGLGAFYASTLSEVSQRLNSL